MTFWTDECIFVLGVISPGQESKDIDMPDVDESSTETGVVGN